MPRIKTFLLICCLLLVGTGPAIQAQALATQSEIGVVKVIVKLKVPGIQGLTNDSRKYKAVWPGKSFDAKGRQADQRLKEAIEKVSNDVLLKLNGTTYKVNHTYMSIPFMALDVSPEALEKLGRMHEVLDIGEDIPRRRGGKNFSSSAGFSESPEVSAPKLDETADIIGAEDVWGMGFTGDGWYIAMIDCGIMTSHDMFAGKNIIEQCYSSDGECPNNQTSMSGTGAAALQDVDCSTIYSDHYEAHGLWTAGVAAGGSVTAHGIAMSGIAPDADIIAVQVCSRDEVHDCIQDYPSDVTSALDFVYSLRGIYPIAAVNLSIGYDPNAPFGSPYYISTTGMTLMTAAIDNLNAINIPSIAATGNSGSCTSILFPASDDGTVAVGASTNGDARWYETYPTQGSDYSAAQDLFAPGVSIYTASNVADIPDVPLALDDPNTADDSYDDAPNGTSLAAPHVTGAWTLMKQMWPTGTISQIKSALVNNGQDVSACNNPVPRVQVADAMNAVRYLSIVRPYGTESVERGDTLTISWNYGSAVSGNVDLVAHTIDGLGYLISLDRPYNSTPFTWTVPAGFPLYSQTTISVSQGNLYSESSPFSVGEINVTSPTAGRNWRSGNTYTITWTSQGLEGNIRIYALEQAMAASSAKNVSKTSYWAGINVISSYPVSAGSYSWTIPQPCDSGAYKIEISQDKVKGYSPVFYINGDIIILPKPDF